MPAPEAAPRVILAQALTHEAFAAYGALIAPGSIVVDSNVKKVQHPTGGVVGEVRARDGDRVRAGDIVVRLDDTVTKASLAIVTKGLNGLLARRARLLAEQEGLDKIFVAAGFEWRESGCSMCFFAGGESFGHRQRVVSTTNRNFEGRQGTGGRTHLVSPAMAAAAAASSARE